MVNQVRERSVNFLIQIKLRWNGAHNVGPWSEADEEVLRPIMKMLADAGQKVLKAGNLFIFNCPNRIGKCGPHGMIADRN